MNGAARALLVEYDGAGFVGWQRQAVGVSVQGALEAAATALAAGGIVSAVAAGRTDAGVHAAGQVVRLTLPDGSPGALVTPDRLRDALNHHLKPHRIAVIRAAVAPDGWSARFSAIGRAYRYVLLDRAARPAIDAGRVWHVPTRLDADAMRAGAAHLLGRHDFTSFRATACQAKSPIRTLDRLEITRDGDRIVIVAEARSFLHHQVRNMVGTLRLVGGCRCAPDDVAAMLAARDRTASGPTAPPEGLTLTAVRYAHDPFSPPAPAPAA